MRSREITAVIAALLLSAIAVAVLYTLLTLSRVEEQWNIVVLSEVLVLARMMFFLALAHSFVLGLPVFLLLRSIKRVGILFCALSGFFIGAVPFGALALSSMFGVQTASTAGKATVINGIPTVLGWIEYARVVGATGALGLAGGLAFWATLRLSNAQDAAIRRPQTQAENHAGSWRMIPVATLLTFAVVLLPNVVRDTSCHNLFRDGQSTIKPQVYGDIKLSAEDWPALKKIFDDFATTHSLSFRSDEQIRRGNAMWRNLSLCSDAGVTIVAIDQLWLARMNSPLADRGISLAVYESKAGADWKALAGDLLNSIEARWPGKTTFRGPDGKVISTQEALKGRY